MHVVLSFIKFWQEEGTGLRSFLGPFSQLIRRQRGLSPPSRASIWRMAEDRHVCFKKCLKGKESYQEIVRTGLLTIVAQAALSLLGGDRSAQESGTEF